MHRKQSTLKRRLQDGARLVISYLAAIALSALALMFMFDTLHASDVRVPDLDYPAAFCLALAFSAFVMLQLLAIDVISGTMGKRQ